jgi:hypothetical protein
MTTEKQRGIQENKLLLLLPTLKKILFFFLFFFSSFLLYLFGFWFLSSPSFYYFLLKTKRKGPGALHRGPALGGYSILPILAGFDIGSKFREPLVRNFGEGDAQNQRSTGSGFVSFCWGEESEAKNRRFELFQKLQTIVRFYERPNGYLGYYTCPSQC